MGLLAPVPVLILLACLSYLAYEVSRPDLLLVGTITVDVVDDGSRPTGGAVSYAAVAAAAYGIRGCVVTVAGPEADHSVFDGHELYVVNASTTLTFEHTYTWFGHQRKLRVTANPNVTLSRAHVPRHCQRARTVLLGPLTQYELDAASFLTYDGFWDWLLRGRQLVGLLGQGYQRRLAADGKVLPLVSPSPQLLAGLGRRKSVSLFLSDVETDPWTPDWMELVSGLSARLLVTQGDKGAVEYNSSGRFQIPIHKVDNVADTNGAGDTFGTAYMLALAHGLRDPASHASWAASRAVMQPQSCKPHCAGELISGNVAPWGLQGRLIEAARRLRASVAEVLETDSAQAGLAVLFQLRDGLPGGVAQLLGAARPSAAPAAAPLHVRQP